MENKWSFTSLCVRESKENRTTRPHILPIYATSSFEFESIDEGMEIFKGEREGHVYSRYGNPTMDAVADKIAMMESHGLESTPDAHCILFSSGMSAILTLILAVLKPGDKILTQGNLYGGTTEQFKKIIGKHGIEPIFIDLKDQDLINQKLASDKKIRMIYAETPANPTLACIDLRHLAEVAKTYGIYTCIDNSFCTPYLQQPFRYGIDFIIHSTTKYLNGHGNSTSGALVGRDGDLMRGEIWEVMKLAGTNCNPFDAWLLNNGMKTLTLRMDRHSSNALEIAQFLAQHKAVDRVNYPGLPAHPDHELAKKQMQNFGGMLSFELKGGLEAGVQFMRNLKFCHLAPTLGDIDTLVLHPASMSHIKIDPALRLANGITDGLIRLSVGIEDSVDIISDLSQAIQEKAAPA